MLFSAFRCKPSPHVQFRDIEALERCLRTTISWQRMVPRRCLHGPVARMLPTSLHQLPRTDVYVLEIAARDIAVGQDKGY